MPIALAFADVARLPAPSDNVAIATRRIEAGTAITLPDGERNASHTILEGHRFAVAPIDVGEPLLSWGLPFGKAISQISPGDYVCNQSMLDALSVRRIEGAHFPAQPNFADELTPFAFNEEAFRPGAPVSPASEPRTFEGYVRDGARGVGTRNYVVVLGTSSRTASFARQLAARLQPLARVHPGIDGIVAIAHTEGGGPSAPNNALEVLRCLAGFMVHPNVAAVVAIDHGVEPLNNTRLQAFLHEHHYPIASVPHAFLTLDHGLAAGLVEGERIVRAWLPEANAARRTAAPVGALRVALQCGGSDAFSGVSGNPLAGALVHEIVRQGGTGVLTETDEAFGAEGYLLKNMRDSATARRFLARIESFRERLSWHGVTAESNPSAGNKLRGLYNITLKSLGAVHKKDPRTRIEFVTDYAEPLRSPGFYFMNGPGNDLEGIAGQVAAGCNLFLFVTGNGSITNFPFVPTLKITTTSRRHQLLIHEMDINAGRYLDGEAMSALTAESLELLIATASGRKTKGEHAGHSQVSLWRNWRQTDTSRLAELRARTVPDGVPLPLGRVLDPPLSFATQRGGPQHRPVVVATRTNDGRIATEQVGLVLPTSLCAAQIARLAAERMNERQLGRQQGIARFVALVHSEGCGFGGETMHALLHRTYRGYVTHPNVAAALLLEHGCEKVPNDVMRRQLEAAGISPTRFGWASVQLDGGIEKALGKVSAWFSERAATWAFPAAASIDPCALTIGLLTAGVVDGSTAKVLAALVRGTIAAGGSILVPESDPLLANEAFRVNALGATPVRATLAYGQPLARAGLHVVATETDHWTENLAGLGGCGAHLALTVIREHARQGHPLLPVIQVAEAAEHGRIPADDLDLFLTGDTATDEAALVDLIARVANRRHVPAASAQGIVDFQLTRGLLGVTT